MEKHNRRTFLKTTAVAATTLASLPVKKLKASPKNILSDDRMGVLVDTTVCIGCRNCEWACKTAHNMPAGNIDDYKNKSVLKSMRRPDKHALTVVNQYNNYDNPSLPYDVKIQCMHCDHPACVSACIVGALSKQENGSVIWDTDKCIGCRYCMVACPFQVPAFEFDKALNPHIKKCDFCFERTKEGKLPACVEICPVEAITYGTRNELVRIAREKIKNYPDRYYNHIYGEYEVGGTSWIYLAGTDFSDLAFPKLSNNPAPGVSESIQHAIFAYFVPPISLYALLGGIMWITRRKKSSEEPE
jgi:formate dehydrogenase iron-sulfur subunit